MVWGCRTRGRCARARLEIGVFIQAQDRFSACQGTCVESDEFLDYGHKPGIAWFLGREPEVMSPGFEVVLGENPPNGFPGDGGYNPFPHQLASNFFAVPLA